MKRITFCFRTSILPNDDKRKKESLVHTKGMWFACLYKPPIVMSPVDVWFVKANMNPSFFSHSFGLSTVSRRKREILVQAPFSRWARFNPKLFFSLLS